MSTELAKAEPPELAVVATGTLTKQEQVDADERYKKKVQQFKEQEKTVMGKALFIQWEKGRFCQELCDQPRHWGNHTVEQFATDMNVSNELVYFYMRFFDRCKETEVKQLVEFGTSWHNVVQSLSVSDSDKRKELLYLCSPAAKEAAKTDKNVKPIDARELQERIKSTNAKAKSEKRKNGQKVDNRGGVSVGTIFKSTVTTCVEMGNKADDLLEAFKTYIVMDDDDPKKDKLSDVLADARKALRNVYDRIGKVLEATE